jgi:hypothetical protein
MKWFLEKYNFLFFLFLQIRFSDLSLISNNCLYRTFHLYQLQLQIFNHMYLTTYDIAKSLLIRSKEIKQENNKLKVIMIITIIIFDIIYFSGENKNIIDKNSGSSPA